jgi:predicted nucleotidyltransferase
MSDLQPWQRDLLLDLLAQYVPRAEVWAFGSRVRGEAHPASDLDLVVRCPRDPEQPMPGLLALRAALCDSPLPFSVDLLDWAAISEGMRQAIAAQYELLRSPDPQ